MSFDWSEYLHLAQELAGQPATVAGEEARLRAAVSRAYYAAFCQARNYLRDKEGHSLPQGSEVHKFVYEKFQKSSDSVRVQIGLNLNRLRIERNKVDYDDTVPGLSKLTHNCIELARRVLQSLSQL